jgi:DNA-binding MarR family transcriptional regulator
MGVFGRLGRLSAHATRAIEEVFVPHGLSIGEFDVLATLRRAGPPHRMPPGALARLLMLSPAGMTNRVDRLEAAGLVERRPDPEDRRSAFVVLTGRGLATVDAAVTEHVANEARLLAPLSASEQRTLDRLLRKLLVPFESSG